MILIDAHVHIYDCFDLEGFFDSAYSNFKSAAKELDFDGDLSGILLLAETSKENWFEWLSNHADGKELPLSKKTGKWSVHRTGDDSCLKVRAADEQKLYLMAGRQIVTAENLEVLALITNRQFEDGKPLERVLQEVRESRAFPVIPWGFAKWTGRRGLVLDKVLSRESVDRFYLGDNGGRTYLLKGPRGLGKSIHNGFKVLPGSDQLPFSFEEGRAGSFGFWCKEPIFEDHPVRGIEGLLRNMELKIHPYGKLENPLLFFFKQVAMQIRKRGRLG